jgi:protein-S-isoprenylcysteine O-methyltransferase Ste14
MALRRELKKQGNWLFTYRSFIPLAVLLIGAAMVIYAEFEPGASFIKETPYESIYEVFCIVVSLFGLYIRIFTVGHTPVNTSGRNASRQIADTLNTTGIYSAVRHPLYLGNFFMWLGPALLAGNFWFIVAFCLFYWVYYERIMYAEEQFLKKSFGKVYTDWAKNVPAFIPSFKNYKKPELPFSWKKILKKEKNGFTAIFLIFTFFDVVGELIHGRTDFNYYLIGICVLTSFLYLILKYLKWHTNVLNESGR